MKTTTNTVAKTMTDADLIHVADALNSELLADMANLASMTQAHVGKVELLTACTDELVARGYVAASYAQHL